MIRAALLLAVLFVLRAWAADPVSVDVARARMAKRIAERQQPTTRPIQHAIEELREKNRELEVKIAEISAEIQRLEAVPTTQAAVRSFGRVEVGMSRTELFALIKAHPDRIRVVRRTELGTNWEGLGVLYFGMTSVGDWIVPPPGVGDRSGRHPEIEARTGNAIIALENGTVVSFRDGAPPPEKEVHSTGR